MSFTHIYTVPAYYPDFHCKAGDCRHPCCVGWDIAISMKEYFRMIGMDCSPQLRRRLDTAFHPPMERSEDHYAVISSRWDGDCPLRLENGFCSLQCECGEAAIPSVCRYYPRSPKSLHAYQCQCSNSCEAVVELLFARREPMTFLRKKLTFQIEQEPPHRSDAVSQLFPSIQRAGLHILQDRSRPLSLRLRHLGELTQVMDVPYRAGNADGLRAVLPFHTVASHGDETHENAPLDDRELRMVLVYLRQWLIWISENNAQLQGEAISVKKHLFMHNQGVPESQVLDTWHRDAARFDQLFPDNERMLEQLFVNHLCYDGFPYPNEGASMWDTYLSFITAYALVRLFSVAYMATVEAPGLFPYVDIVCALFRLISHTNFDHNAPILARHSGFDHPERAFLLCRI